MPAERNSLVQSIRITGNGIALTLRIVRSRPQDLEAFLRENDLAVQFDFDVPARSISEATNSDAMDAHALEVESTNPSRQLFAA